MNLPLPTPPTNILGNEDILVRFERFTEGNEEKGFAPGYHFRILTSDLIDVGHVNIRIGHSDHVTRCAGHVGFEIHPEHRGKRYASKACKALSGFVSEAIGSPIITTDSDNIASIKTIERIGAIFMDEVDVPKADPHYARGSRRKRRYRWTPRHVEPDGGPNPVPLRFTG